MDDKLDRARDFTETLTDLSEMYDPVWPDKRNSLHNNLAQYTSETSESKKLPIEIFYKKNVNVGLMILNNALEIAWVRTVSLLHCRKNSCQTNRRSTSVALNYLRYYAFSMERTRTL